MNSSNTRESCTKKGEYMFVHKPHAVCIPWPAQGHINPMLSFSKLLHSKGFHVTFVHSDHICRRLLESQGPDYLSGLPDFRFETIPDGLTDDAERDIQTICESFSRTGLGPFRELILKLNNLSGLPPVTVIISDGVMSFTLGAAEEFGIPAVTFWTMSASGFLAYVHFHQLREKGFTPLKDASYLTNGYLDTVIDWIPGLKNIRLRDLPTFIRTTDPNDFMLHFMPQEFEATNSKASAVIVNTFDALEHDVLNALSTIMSPPLYTIGPLHLLLDQTPDVVGSKRIGSNLWKEQSECMEWLDSKPPSSVLYVNFGSIMKMSREQMIEFAWGLANSKKDFLWIIRPDILGGDSPILPKEFFDETKERGMLAPWCTQKEILKHSSIGCFLTHCGWNSVLESICCGVPMICWPFFTEQQTNCRISCAEWGVGLEIDSDVKRDEVEKLVREVMEGEKGKEMKEKILVWKIHAEEAVEFGGSSYTNVEKLINQMLSSSL